MAVRAAGRPVLPAVTLDDVLRARTVLSGVTRVTALEGSRHLSRLIGGPVRLKCENLQRTGSFKVRGAYTRIAGLSQGERAAGVVAASAGNHAQGVALAAALLGVRATVFMPVSAPLPKVAATRAYGAEVRLRGQVLDEALSEARRCARATGAVFVHPFDHPDVITGQGTVGLEILQQCPEVRTIVVAVGGGGLAAGIATAVKALRPDVRIVGVQAAGAAAYPPSLAAGHPVALAKPVTMADGILVGRPGDVPFGIVRELVDAVRTVSEDALAGALLLCLERAKMVVEPAGAAPVAALLADPDSFEGPLVAVLSGGNVDPLLLQRVLRHGMAAAGRYLSLRLRLTDRPGALAALLEVLSAADANVLDIGHVRTDPRLGLAEAEVELHLETKGPAHCEEVAAALREAGYRTAG
ncbi:threonine ammonia-lyase [Streptomyces klenkii]|uniref:threonine ammonia-lyase n=1 Tax=Streptomyces klenkii TaxID=1420899 RepID=A0A3B0BVV6_9ACTN|nr:threonine ammonia-lyase [Streptomyces klenkii]RKN76117.1 threonine ammonia-lyase [Streptomyces klenkii]